MSISSTNFLNSNTDGRKGRPAVFLPPSDTPPPSENVEAGFFKEGLFRFGRGSVGFWRDRDYTRPPAHLCNFMCTMGIEFKDGHAEANGFCRSPILIFALAFAFALRTPCLPRVGFCGGLRFSCPQALVHRHLSISPLFLFLVCTIV